MDENTVIPFSLTVKEIQVLNNIITNSTPTVPFLVVSQLVQKINSQIEQETQKPKADTPVDAVQE